jgi:hypothetical protein
MSVGGDPEVVKKGRRVRVVLVELVPQAGNPPRFHVARRQRGLAVAPRRPDPGAGPVRQFVQPREQSLARESRRQPGPVHLGRRDGVFGERRSVLFHVGVLATVVTCPRGRETRRTWSGRFRRPRHSNP